MAKKKDKSVYYKGMRFFQYKMVKLITTILIILALSTSVLFAIKWSLKTFVYKMPYREEVLLLCDKYGINPLYVYSVIKVESSFNEKAKSQADAKGLMQLTDKTAKFIARRLNIKDYDIFDAKTNLTFGVYYLSYLKEKFKVLDTVTCAYNAGEGNVIKWLKNKEYSKDGKTLNKVPFKETRGYREKIKKTFAKYEKLYGNILDKSKNFE